MDLSRHLILLNDEAKTPQIESIEQSALGEYRVRFKNNPKLYTYGMFKVVWLSDPEWINVANSRVYVDGIAQTDIREVWNSRAV